MKSKDMYIILSCGLTEKVIEYENVKNMHAWKFVFIYQFNLCFA